MNTYNMKFHAWFRGVLGGLLVAFIASCDDSDLIRRVEPTLEIQDELSMGPVASRQVIDLSMLVLAEQCIEAIPRNGLK